MDGELIFQVQGSAPDPFKVTFARKGDQLSATCTCNAGRLGKLCKHRLGLMKGDPTGIVGNNADQVPRIHDLFQGTEGSAAMKGLLEAELALSEAQQVFTLKKLAFLAAIQT